MLCVYSCRKPYNSGAVFSDTSTLTTSILQEQVLQTLNEHTVISFNTISEENRCICRIMFIFTIDSGSSHNNFLVDAKYSRFSVKQTIVKYSDPDALVTERPLVANNDGNHYSTNPINDYISQWDDRFKDCLACGSDIPRSVTCTQKDDVTGKR